MSCSFCGKRYPADSEDGEKGLVGNPAHSDARICRACIRSVSLAETPDGVSLHPTLKRAMP